MPDLIDRAQELDLARGELINQVRPADADAVDEPLCWTCGEEIPERRRAAVPGVRHCVACASAAERRDRLFAVGR